MPIDLNHHKTCEERYKIKLKLAQILECDDNYEQINLAIPIIDELERQSIICNNNKITVKGVTIDRENAMLGFRYKVIENTKVSYNGEEFSIDIKFENDTWEQIIK